MRSATLFAILFLAATGASAAAAQSYPAGNTLKVGTRAEADAKAAEQAEARR